MAKRTVGRVKIPKTPKTLLQIAEIIYAKHLAEAANSPLNLLSDEDWGNTGPKIATTFAQHNLAETAKLQMETAYRQRDINMPEIERIVRTSIGLLKKVYSKNPKRLGEWGINVDDTPQ